MKHSGLYTYVLARGTRNLIQADKNCFCRPAGLGYQPWRAAGGERSCIRGKKEEMLHCFLPQYSRKNCCQLNQSWVRVE